MKRPNNPCYGCTERWVNEVTNCHPTCKRYAEFQAMNRAFNDAMRKNSDAGYNGKKWYQSQTGWWRRQ